jgi:hypothetical protein
MSANATQYCTLIASGAVYADARLVALRALLTDADKSSVAAWLRGQGLLNGTWNWAVPLPADPMRAIGGRGRYPWSVE